MKEKRTSQKQLRQRKFLLVLPVLVLPFLMLGFWALGGGQGGQKEKQSNKQTGLNTRLPGASLKESDDLNKLSYYEQAARDSQKVDEWMRSDPYYRSQPDGEAVTPREAGNDTSLSYSMLPREGAFNLSNHHRPALQSLNGKTQDANEAKVYRKISELNAALESAAAPTMAADTVSGRTTGPAMNSGDVDRLEQMMQMMNEGASGEDPQLKQLSGMLDKLVEVQNPELVRERLRKASEQQRGRVFSVEGRSNGGNVSLLGGAPEAPQKQDDQVHFYSADERSGERSAPNAIEAVVHETQTIVTGSTIKLRLTGEIYINGLLIPSGSFVYGTASLSDDRLSIKVTSVRHRSSILPVDLAVHDMDGIAGIFIPGAISRDVAKQSADQSIQSFGLATYDPSLGAQAASAGIEAAKSLLSRKVKLIKVTVKAGYRVLLFDKNQKQ